jgi:hypothetical protein
MREKMKYRTIFTIMPLPLFYLNQLYPIIHCPIVHILDIEKHKLLFVHGYGKNPASNEAEDISNVRHCDNEEGKITMS